MPRRDNISDLLFSDTTSMKSYDEANQDVQEQEEIKKNDKEEPIPPISDEAKDNIEKADSKKQRLVEYSEYEDMLKKMQEMTGVVEALKNKHSEYDEVFSGLRKTKAFTQEGSGTLGRRRGVWFG